MNREEIAEVLAGHIPTTSSGMFNMNGGGATRYCSCGERIDVRYSELDDNEFTTEPMLAKKLAHHIAGALKDAGI